LGLVSCVDDAGKGCESAPERDPVSNGFVECGLAENSGKTFAGEILGTDSAHKKTHALVCQEYVVQSDKMTYRIRPRDEKHPALLPVGEKPQFSDGEGQDEASRRGPG
jgi:hypothetical protein